MFNLACPTIGCGMTGSEAYIERHLSKQHSACSCGWAGISFGGHVASVGRRLSEGYKDPGEGVHDKIAMDFNYELGRWVRISTPA